MQGRALEEHEEFTVPLHTRCFFMTELTVISGVLLNPRFKILSEDPKKKKNT